MTSLPRGRAPTLAAIALALVAVAGCGTAQAPASALADALIGAPAPELAGPQLSNAGELDLQSLTGKPTVVVFWFAQCPHCQETLPALDAAWSEVEDDANVLTVGMPHPDPDVETTAGFESPADFVETTGLSLPTILGDWDASVSEWKVEGVPTVFVLDADHVVQRILVGPDASAIIDAVRGL